LASGQLELSNTGGTQAIIGPAAGVTVSARGQTRVLQVDDGVTASISGLTITGGGGTADRGGGVLNLGNLTLKACTVSGNTATKARSYSYTYGGGGIANYGTATLIECTVSGNKAIPGPARFAVVGGNGGGILNKGTAILTNCTISANRAYGLYGGGLANRGTAILTNCTISGNSVAGSNAGGGGLSNASNALTLTNTIVAGNTNSSSAPSDISGAVSGTYNLIGIGGSGGLTYGVNHNIVLTTLTDLRLAPLAFYGGPTQTMALQPGSMAIGKGNAVSGITTDQRGFKLAVVNPDIGAFQSRSGPLIVSTTTDGTGVPLGQFDLRAAVNLADVDTGANTITFDPSVFAKAQTITLASGQLELSNGGGTQTIKGPAEGVTINGAKLSRVFQVDNFVTASISGLTITEGAATLRGGGLFNAGKAYLTNCTFRGNTAVYGGGVSNYNQLTLSNCNVSGNMVSNQGGGVFNKGTATVTDCSVTENESKGLGGGLWNTGEETLTNSTVNGNRGLLGGGLFNTRDAYTAGVLTMVNCTISGNAVPTNAHVGRGGGGGGGVLNFEGGTVNLSNCTVSDNAAAYGGGLVNGGTANMANTIVARNTAPTGAPDVFGSVHSLGNNLIGETNDSAGWVPPGSSNSDLTGTIAKPLEPLLESLRNNGGPTQTMALEANSPAVHKGVAVFGVTSDQRGLPLDSPPDIGAFQIQHPHGPTIRVRSLARPKLSASLASISRF
jgi:hypothetical protein